MSTSTRIQSMVVDQLAHREMELLTLVVAVRRALGQRDLPKGDLGGIVRSALKTLVASNAVVDHDGRYSLARATEVTDSGLPCGD
jgi:hypothetical protein